MSLNIKDITSYMNIKQTQNNNAINYVQSEYTVPILI